MLFFVVEVIEIVKIQKELKTELATTHTNTDANWRRSPFVVHAGPKISDDILEKERQV